MWQHKVTPQDTVSQSFDRSISQLYIGVKLYRKLFLPTPGVLQSAAFISSFINDVI